jgi:hypothetical protein
MGQDDGLDVYPCAECGTPRTKAQGGTVFTVCEKCWEKAYPRPAPEGEPDIILAFCEKHGRAQLRVAAYAVVEEHCAACLKARHEAELAELREELEAANAKARDLEQSEAALVLKVEALAPHGTCACSWDAPHDECLHHSPQIIELRRRLEEAERRLGSFVVHTLQKHWGLVGAMAMEFDVTFPDGEPRARPKGGWQDSVLRAALRESE